jgi:hypothetical protein
MKLATILRNWEVVKSISELQIGYSYMNYFVAVSSSQIWLNIFIKAEYFLFKLND